MLQLLQHPAIIRLIASVVLVTAVLIARHVFARWISGGTHMLNDLQRRQMFYLRSAVTASILVGLVVIWASALQNLLLSLTAVTLAVVIATKELLMCLSGFVMRTTNRLFSVGDWIECNGMRGEVADYTLMSTRILELESAEYGYGYTGRSLILPNSLFLTFPVYTSPPARHYVHHRFGITLEFPIEAAAGLDWLRQRTERLCAPYIDEGRELNQATDRRLGVDVAGPEPFVSVTTTDIGKIRYLVLLFCPIDKAPELERAIVSDFLRAAYAGQFPCKPGPAEPLPCPST